MKELQNFVYKYMDSLKHHKRYLAMLTALSMLVTFIVPLILMEPADSMTGVLVCKKVVHTHNAECYVGSTLVCNIEEHIHTGECYKKVSLLSLKGDSESNTNVHGDNENIPNAGGGYDKSKGTYTPGNAHPVDATGTTFYNPDELPLYTLLFGEGTDHWVDSSKSLEENLEIVDDEYFLGFASDFCAFIESDFTAFDADAEGRMFVGGDLIFNGIPNGKKWNYQVGAGDYGHFTPIGDTDEYSGIKGFASGIIGGKVFRLGTMTTGAHSALNFASPPPNGKPVRHNDGNDVMLYPEEGAYKRFVVGNLKDSLHYDEDVEVDIPYDVLCNHLYYDHSCDECKGLTNEEMALNAHSYLGKVNELSQFYLYNDVGTILERTFDTLRARSLSLASVQAIEGKIDNNILELDASNIGDAKTAYFKISDWKNFSNVVIIVPDDRITYTEPGDKEENFTGGSKTIKNLDLNIIVSCDKELIEITQNTATYIRASSDNTKEKLEKLDDKLGYKISNRNANATNNHPVSSNILYNFYNATKVSFTGDTNFNGTIFAPNAKVTAPETCRGHLSGALIAKSFYGGLEFGYRPYRGGVDIFGMTSGYAIPVDKFGDDGKTALPGALFAIKEDGKFVSLFESGYGTNFAALPSRVDFTGGTIYKRDEVIQEEGADKTFAGNTVAGEKLLAPVSFTLHTDSSCTDNNKIETTLDNLWTKIYLKPNQNVNIEDSADYIVDGPDNDGIYTIQLIKPVTNLTITARNQGDGTDEKTATVNFTPKMALNATSTDNQGNLKFEIDRDIELQTIDFPIGDIWYTYYINGEVIKNDSTQNNERTQSSIVSYRPNAPGDYIFSVKAFVKVNEEFYEISQATANKVTIAKPQLPNDLRITLSGNTLESDGTNYTITSGNNIKVNLNKQQELPEGTTVEYAFYNSRYQSYNEFITNDIVGKDLLVKVRIALPNEEPVVLQETITVNFKEMNYNDYSESYEVNSNNYYYFSLQNVPNGATVEYYFNKKKLDGYSVAQTVVGDNIAVYAYVSANGLVEKVEGKSVKGYYNNLLAIKTSTGPYIVGNSINVSVDYAPYGSKVVFMALNENNEEVWTSNEQTVYNTTCGDYFMPEESGNYTFKAFIKLADNPDNILTSNNIKVEAKPVTGQFTINPTEVFTDNTVEFRVYNATVGANVTFQIKDQSGNYQNPLNGTVDNNGECKISYTPLQAGNYTVVALISKDGKSASLQQNLTVKENSSALTGEFSVTPNTLNPGTNVAINVYNATNGASVEVNITRPDNHTDRQSGNINNGSFSCQYSNTGVEGVYTVNVRLILNGITYDIPAKTFTLSSSSNSDTSRTGELTLSGGTYVPNVPIQFTVNNTNGNYVAFNVVYNGNGQTVYSYGKEVVNGSVTVEFTPGGTGSHTVKATIDGVTELTQTFEVVDNSSNQQPESDPTAGLSISVSKLPYEVNTDQVTLSVINLPGGARVEYYISGQKVADSANPTFKPDRPGQFDLEARITFADNSTRSIYTKIYDTTNVPQNTMSYAFRKYLSILAAEDANSDLNDNKIIITTADDSTRISNVRLTFPSVIDAKETKFKLKVTSNGSNSTDYYPTNANVSDQSPYYLDIPVSVFSSDSDITEIEITPVSGSITIDKCYPTLIKDETKITQTYVQDFTLKQNEEIEIVIDDWTIADNTVQTLDSISFNLGSNGKIYYALIEKPEPGEEAKTPVFIEANASDDKVISIPNINAENIEKIKIYTTDDFLTVNDYTISAYIGSTDTYANDGSELRTKTQDVVNYYTLVEQQAPVGYFKEDSVYNIEVKETIALDKVNGANIPTEVITTITAKDMNGNVALSYKLKISNTGTDERIITILGENDVETDSFTLKKNGDGKLTVSSDTIDTSNWDTMKDGENDDYYLDVEAMMIVPVPQPIEYTNRIGLLFRKIDNKGASVKGVKIALYKGDEKITDTNLWYWDENSSEWLIDYTQLTTGSVYKLTETDAGGMFEPAKDIYFEKTGDKVITYWIEENQKTVLKLNENFESRVIRMENIRIPGLKPTVVKTKLDGDIINGNGTDAVFSLHANNGTELLDNVTITDGKIELNLNESDAKNTAYIENGYLKPGTYYLKEIKAPSGYEPSMKFFYFNVEQNEKGAFSITPVEKRPGISVLTEVVDNENCEITRFTINALNQIDDTMIINKDVVLQFTLNTSNSTELTEKWKNYRFMGNHNEQYLKPSKIEVSNANVTYKLTAEDMLKLLGITPISDDAATTDKNEFVEQFRKLTVFEIGTVNSTKVVDWQFLEFENKAEDISKITIGDSSNVKIDGFKITYNNGTSFEKGNSTITIENNELKLPEGCSLKNVAKIELTASGFSGDKNVIIETTDGRKIWGNIQNIHNNYPNYSDSYKKINEGILCEFGFTPDTTSTDPETPTTYDFPTLTVKPGDRNTIYISNDVVKPTMKLRAEKKWVGDTGITELRQPVEVQLMQKVGVDGTYDAYNPTVDENNQPTGSTVTLNEANDWSYIWEDLPRYVNDENAEGGLYYYTVKEITAVPGYKTENPNEDINEGGTIVITNTAETVDIPVEKNWTWDEKYENPPIPRTVKFKLQVYVNSRWTDVPGKTLTITGNGSNWSGEFTGLIEGYEYKIVEVDVPFGWLPSVGANVDTSNENETDSFTVTNTYVIKEGSIALQKLWQDLNDNDVVLPDAIYLDLYRSVVAPSYTKTNAPYTDKDEPGSTVDGKPKYMSDYARLLQHSLYFYDANMCGADVAENSALAWRTNCHTEDAVPGGYHDAGDHVMFGLPQGYTASMLGWSYLEFIKENESGYKVSDAEKEHYKVILERFYEFFANSVEYGSDGLIKKLLVQKGHGNVDHLIWCAPEIQKNREDEMIWSETSGSNIAAEYAAALALGYINFRNDTNAETYDKYLKLAEDLYEFAGRTSSFVASDSMGEYYADTDSGDDMAWAAAWLYEATGIQQYADERLSDSANLNPTTMHEGLQWDDVRFAALCATARSTGNWDTAKDYIQKKYFDGGRKDYYYIHAWGTARFNATAQTATLIVAKHLKAKGDTDTATTYVDWVKDQMNKLLGDNTWKNPISENGCAGGTVDTTKNYPICLVTNFVPDGYDIDTPQAPHHRAASGLDSVNGDSNGEYLVNCGYDDDRYTLIGALAGGPSFGSHDDGKQQQMYDYDHDHPLANHTYIDDLHDYCCNEVAIDYNSGLVGAAAGLFYFEGTGERSEMIEGVEFGAYGLKGVEELENYTDENGLESPIKSAVPESAQGASIASVSDEITGKVLKSFAMKQTSVRIMDDELSVNFKNLGWAFLYTIDVSSIEDGESIDIIISGNDQSFDIQINNPKSYQSTVAANQPTTINYNPGNWNGMSSIELYNYNVSNYTGTMPTIIAKKHVETNLEETEFAFTTGTPADNSENNVKQSMTFKTNEAATWTSNITDNSIIQFSPNGTECTVQFLKYTDQSLTITATSSSDPTKSVSRTVKAKPLQITYNPSNEIEAGSPVQLGINYTPEGTYIKYYYENDTEIKDPTSFKPSSSQKIIAKAIDNSNQDEVARAEGYVTVKQPELKFTDDTPNDWTYFNVRQTMTFKTNQAATWNVKLGDNVIDSNSTDVQFTVNGDGTECTVKFLKYTDKNLSVTATSSSDTSKYVYRTVKAKKMTLKSEPTEVSKGTPIKLIAENKPAEGEVRYYYNGSQISENYTPQSSGDFTFTAKAIIDGDEDNPIDTATVIVNVTEKAKPTISIDKSTITYGNGETAKLTVSPSDSITYYQIRKSDNSDNGLRIENGTITPNENGVGSYEIWVERDGVSSDRVTLTVKQQMSINDNNSTNGNNTAIKVGDYVTFTLNPDAEIQYSPNNENGLTVDNDNNKVTAAKAGTYEVWTFVNGVKSDVIELTVTDGSGNEPSGVTAPDGYELVYVKNEDKGLSGYTVFDNNNVPSELSGKTIDYIIVQFSYNETLNGDFNGAFYYNGKEKKFHSKNSDGDWNLIENGLLCIPIDPGIEISSASFASWNNQLEAKVENIYFYYLPPSLTITYDDEKTNLVEIAEGDTITLKQMYKADNSSVTWKLNGEKVKEGSDEYNFTVPNVSETTNYTITASDETNEDTITIRVNPLTINKINDNNTVTVLEPIMLGMNTTRDLSEFNWDSSAPNIISVENGVLTVKNNGSATITATDKKNSAITASITVTADVETTDLVISGYGSTGIGGEIKLTYSGGPIGVDKYQWTSLNPDKATVDQNGKVIGIAEGTATIQLQAYNSAGEAIGNAATKEIAISEWFAKTLWEQGKESNSDSDGKYFYSLSGLGSGAILKRVTIHVTPTNGQETDYSGGLMVGKEKSSPEPWNQLNISGKLSANGNVFVINEDKMTNIDCTKHDFCFGLWGSNCEVNIDWVTFEYEKDTTYIEVKYDEGSSNTIRKGEEVSFTVIPTGGEIGSVQLKNGETVVETYEVTDPANTFNKTIKPTVAGEYTIVAVMAGEENKDEIASITLTVKDDFSISQDKVTIGGTTFVDINNITTFRVNNLMGEGPNWQITADEEVYEITDEENVVIITKKADGTEIARFDKSTGKLTTRDVDGEFILTASDSYDNSEVSVTIRIADRPKLPELPKDIFLGDKITEIKLTKNDKIGDETWAKVIESLPMTDEKGNPYYYYIQETGYSTNGNYHPMESTDNFIYSSNASYMPYNYYNNGIVPVENPGDQNSIKVAKVGNKFLSKQEGQLPSTGGSGARTYYYFGGALMLLGIAGFTSLKRRERKRRKE